MCEVDTYIYEERSFLCPVVRNRSLKIAKIDQHDGIAAGFGIAAAILEIVSKSQKQARYGTEKNVSQMCGTKMNAHFSLSYTSARKRDIPPIREKAPDTEHLQKVHEPRRRANEQRQRDGRCANPRNKLRPYEGVNGAG